MLLTFLFIHAHIYSCVFLCICLVKDYEASWLFFGEGVVWCGVLWGGYKRPVLVGGVESEVLGVTEKKPPASLSPAGLCWLVLK